MYLKQTLKNKCKKRIGMLLLLPVYVYNIPNGIRMYYYIIKTV